MLIFYIISIALDVDMDEPTVTLTMDERCTRAMLSAVSYTLENWSGQGELDQEYLLSLKPFLQGCTLEFNFHRFED